MRENIIQANTICSTIFLRRRESCVHKSPPRLEFSIYILYTLIWGNILYVEHIHMQNTHRAINDTIFTRSKYYAINVANANAYRSVNRFVSGFLMINIFVINTTTNKVIFNLFAIKIFDLHFLPNPTFRKSINFTHQCTSKEDPNPYEQQFIANVCDMCWFMYLIWSKSLTTDETWNAFNGLRPGLRSWVGCHPSCWVKVWVPEKLNFTIGTAHIQSSRGIPLSIRINSSVEPHSHTRNVVWLLNDTNSLNKIPVLEIYV